MINSVIHFHPLKVRFATNLIMIAQLQRIVALPIATTAFVPRTAWQIVKPVPQALTAALLTVSMDCAVPIRALLEQLHAELTLIAALTSATMTQIIMKATALLHVLRAMIVLAEVFAATISASNVLQRATIVLTILSAAIILSAHLANALLQVRVATLAYLSSSSTSASQSSLWQPLVVADTIAGRRQRELNRKEGHRK